MKFKLAAVAVALLLVGTVAAMAAPGNAPDDVPADDHANESAQDVNESDDTAEAARDSADTESDNESDEADSNATDEERRGPPVDEQADGDERGPPADVDQGPPADLPEQVPGFVGDVHDAIRDKISGDVTGLELGERISSLTPSDSDEAQDVGNAPEDAGNVSDHNESDSPTPDTPADDDGDA